MYMYVMGRSVCTCDVPMCVLVWRACVCCVGGLIMESHERRTPVWEKEEEEEEEERCMQEEWMGGCRFIFSSHYLIHIFLHMSRGKGVSVCLVSICMHETIPLIHGMSPSCIRWLILSWWILCIGELSDLFRDQWRLTALTVHHTQSTGLVLYLEPTLIWAAEDYHPLMKNWWKILTLNINVLRIAFIIRSNKKMLTYFISKGKHQFNLITLIAEFCLIIA